MYAIEILNYIKATPEKVFETLTTEKGLSAIWTKKLKVKPEINHINEFDFDEDDITKMKVTALVPNSLVKWDCIESDEDWTGTKVSFEISEHQGKTMVLLKHYNWKETNNYMRWCNYNWSLFLKELKTFCEK